MTRITNQSARWGNKDVDHIEFRWQGEIMSLTITDDKIELLGPDLLDVDHRWVNKVVVKVQEHTVPPITPVRIDGPGWYRTASGHRAKVAGCDSAGHTWYGVIEEWGEPATWRKTGEIEDGCADWTLVVKESAFPCPITEPGAYCAQNGDRVLIKRGSGTGHWIGEVENKTRHQIWRSNGTHADDYHPWNIVAKE